MANTIVWVDVPVRDLKRATEFYSRVLGTKLEIVDAGNFHVTVLPHAGTDVSGCLFESDNVGTNGPLIYFNVEGRLPAAAAEAASGGTVLEPPHSIQPHGFRAVVLDSEGNRIALHSTAGDSV